jgi:hypothetical protein
VADAELVRAAGRYREGAEVGLAHLLPGEAPGHVGFTAGLESTIPLSVTDPRQSQHFDLTPVAGSGKGPFLFTRDQKYCRMSVSVGLCLTATLSQRVDHLYPSGRLGLNTLMADKVPPLHAVGYSLTSVLRSPAGFTAPSLGPCAHSARSVLMSTQMRSHLKGKPSHAFCASGKARW